VILHQLAPRGSLLGVWAARRAGGTSQKSRTQFPTARPRLYERRVMPIEKSDFRPGDALYFHGFGAVGVGINLFTRGWPFRWPAGWAGFSHVGTIGFHPDEPGELALWESTAGCDQRDLVTDAWVDGVQAHAIERRISRYDGMIWHCPMTDAAREFFKVEAAQAFLRKAAKRPYDWHQSFQAQDTLLGKICRRLCWHRANDAFFCSELVAGTWRAGFGALGECQYSPNKLYRTARRLGIIRSGARVK